MKSFSVKITVLIVGLWIACALVFAGSLPLRWTASFPDLVAFIALAAVTELWYVSIGKENSMSLSFTVHFAAAVLFGPAFAMLVVIVGLLVSDGLVRRAPLNRMAFNMGQMALAAGLCAAAYDLLRVPGPVDLVRDAPALAVAALVYLVVNHSLVTLVLSLRGSSFWREWRLSFRDLLIPYASMAPLGAMGAFVFRTQPWAVLYFVPLVYVIYNGFKLFVSLQRETDDTLVALADSIDRRDSYTYQHSMRVAEHVKKTSTQLGLSLREVDMIAAAARVHDLGKIATDNRLLLKPALLTSEERRQIEAHAVEGEVLAARFSMFRQGRRSIRHHHERWDGTGYPDGLAGKAIPLGARLIAIADTFDAMTTDRPHRRALPAEEAVSELRHCAGTQFDPALVEAFIATLSADVGVTLAETGSQSQTRPPSDVVEELSVSRDPAELWAAGALSLAQLLDVPGCDIMRRETDTQLVCVAAVRNGQWYPSGLGRRSASDGDSLERGVLVTSRTALIGSPADLRLSTVERAAMADWHEHSRAVVPLIVRGETIGVAAIAESRESRSLTEEQLATAESLCRLISSAIHDAEAVEDHRLQARRLSALLESSRAVTSARTMENALEVVSRRAAELLELDCCIAYEFERHQGTMTARAVWERKASGVIADGQTVALCERAAERITLESGVLRLQNESDPTLDPESLAAMRAQGLKSRLLVAMQSTDGVMGLFLLGDRNRTRRFSEEELALAASLAELAGEAIRGARLLHRMRSLSETDSLTGLANRRKLGELHSIVHAGADRYGSNYSLVMLDIDGFKSLNDTHGHLVGDAVLRHVAKVLTSETRASDIVGRYGGDELMLILPETGSVDAMTLAEKLCTILGDESCVTQAGERLRVRASFGIATYPADGTGTHDLIAVADGNLYASKRRGGSTVTGGAAGREVARSAGGRLFSLPLGRAAER